MDGGDLHGAGIGVDAPHGDLVVVVVGCHEFVEYPQSLGRFATAPVERCCEQFGDVIEIGQVSVAFGPAEHRAEQRSARFLLVVEGADAAAVQPVGHEAHLLLQASEHTFGMVSAQLGGVGEQEPSECGGAHRGGMMWSGKRREQEPPLFDGGALQY